jgi:plastocyanin
MHEMSRLASARSPRWEVSAYVWAPSQVIVHQGDEVTLEFVGAHPTEIKGLDKAFTLKRGHVMQIQFKAETSGIFPIVCNTHQPSMRAQVVVLPRTRSRLETRG